MADRKPLTDCVAVVAGATRGAGRGIARALGEAGAAVYCTGRSVRGNPSPYKRPETIEETADLVTAAGGTGIAIRVDHTIEEEVRALFQRVQRERKRLDLLVSSIAGEDPLLGGWTTFWKTDLQNASAALTQSLVSHLITAKHAAPLMIKRKRGLIVEVTEGDMLFGAGNAVSGVVKSSLKAFAAAMSGELYAHGVAAIAITPGFLRSESMLQHFGVTEGNWRDGGKRDKHFLESETPLFLGRAVAALAADPNVLARSGDILSSWEVAREYGVSDADGRRPDWGTYFGQILPEIGFVEPVTRYAAFLDRMKRRADRYLELSAVAASARSSSTRVKKDA